MSASSENDDSERPLTTGPRAANHDPCPKSKTTWLNGSLADNAAKSLPLLLATAFALSFIASNFERKQHMQLYGLPMAKTTHQSPLKLEFVPFENGVDVLSGPMLKGRLDSDASERELSHAFSPGCLAYKPGKNSGMFPIALANGSFHELKFLHWDHVNNIKEPSSTLQKAYPGVNIFTKRVEVEGDGTAPWSQRRTLFSYIPPASFNFWLQYTSVFEPQFVNILSIVDPVLRLRTHASMIDAVAYNAICTGGTDAGSSLAELEMGTVSETGRKLHLIALSVMHGLRKVLFRPADCAEWRERLQLTEDGLVAGEGEGEGDGGEAYKVAACFETLIVPRAYSLGQFYSNQLRVEYDSVHHFRYAFYSTYNMAEPASVCSKISAAVDGGRRAELTVGIFGREDSSHRRLSNADEIEEWVRSGELYISGARLRVVRMRSMSGPLERIANTLSNIDILIAPHGAHWANAIFLPEHAVGIEVNAGCWPEANYNPWQEFHRGSASFAHVMDSLSLRNYEVYACAAALNASMPDHWTVPNSNRFNCNSLRAAGTCSFAASLDALSAVFAMVEDVATGAPRGVFGERNRRDRECRAGCCTHAEVDCESRDAPLCGAATLPPPRVRRTTDAAHRKLDPATLPRVPQD